MSDKLQRLKRRVSSMKIASDKSYTFTGDEELRTMFGSESIAYGNVLALIETLLSEEQNDAVCDATEVDSSTKAG